MSTPSAANLVSNRAPAPVSSDGFFQIWRGLQNELTASMAVSQATTRALDTVHAAADHMTGGARAAITTIGTDGLHSNVNKNMLDEMARDIELAETLIAHATQGIDFPRLSEDPEYALAVARDIGQTGIMFRQRGLENADKILTRLKDQYVYDMPAVLVRLYQEPEDSALLPQARELSTKMRAAVDRFSALVDNFNALIGTFNAVPEPTTFSGLAFTDMMIKSRADLPEADKRERRKDPEQEYYTQYKLPEDKSLSLSMQHILDDSPRLYRKREREETTKDSEYSFATDRRIYNYAHTYADEQATAMAQEVAEQLYNELGKLGYTATELDANRPGVKAGFAAAMDILLAVPGLYTETYGERPQDPAWGAAMEKAIEAFHKQAQAHGEVFINIDALPSTSIRFLMTGDQEILSQN